MRPTIVLVHGAFAESSSWDQVIDRLLDAGHQVIAVANPLRGLAADAACVSDHLRAIEGPVVLVGHSYGGSVISNVDPDAGEIVGLVYVAARRQLFRAVGRLPRQHARRRAAGHPAQRRHDRPGDRPGALPRAVRRGCPGAASGTDGSQPAAGQQGALVEPSGDRPLWKELPSWFVFGEEDRNIPKALQHFMAERAHAHRTVEIPGASHAIAVAHPGTTAGLILEAAALHAAA
jgi:pimeloyl-ACP methyl ester carboxylesterase